MNKKLLKGAMLGSVSTLALAVTAPAAMADIIMETEVFSFSNFSTRLGNVPGQQTLTFDEFDPSLGSLNEIKFVLTSSGNVSGTLFAQDSGGSGAVSATGTITGSMALDVPFLGAGAELSNTDLSSTNNCSEFFSGTCSASLSDSTVFNDMFTVAVGDFGLFEGTGTFNVNFDTIRGLTCETTGSGDEECSFTRAEFFGGGNVKLTYTFDPAIEVPEPGTLALFGVGLAGMGVLSRRRRRSSAPPGDA